MEEILDKQKFKLIDREGEYVERVESTGLDTVKVQFHFTKDPQKARIFSYQDLFSRQETTAIGIEFQRGYAGRLIRV